MSIEELEARIGELSFDIDRQREILTKLERDKSLLQRQLNTLRDPIAQLPLEISSEIFLQCLPPHPKPGPHHLPTLFLDICHSWTTIATSTPTLWATLRIDFPCAKGSEKTVERWLERAGSCSLDITLTGYIHPEVVRVIWGWSEQLEALQILFAEMDRVGEDDYGVRELLGGVVPGSLPSLKTLVVRCEDQVGCLWSDILDLLRGSPNLAEVILDCIDALDGVDEGMEAVVLPNLRRMTFGRHPGLPAGNDELLKVITAPQLETLTLAMKRIDDDDLTSFLLRSSPPLQHLVLAKCPLLSMEHGFSAVPTLTRLGLWSSHPRELVPLFRLLAQPDLKADLLPNLRNLDLHFVYIEDQYIEDQLDTNLRWLMAMRPQMPDGSSLGVFIHNMPAEQAQLDSLLRSALQELSESAEEMGMTVTYMYRYSPPLNIR